MPPLDVPADWQRSVERILKHEWRRILVLGATDRGKSTYCLFLAQTLCDAGARVGYVDADTGQKDIGPPAAITRADFEGRVDRSKARISGFYFVGATSPMGHFLPMIVGTRRLADSPGASYVIVNTTGLIRGPGRALKTAKIESLRPDAIVAIEEGGELEPILRANAHVSTIRLRPSPRVRAKSREARTALREEAFRAYFRNAETIAFDVSRLIVQRTLLFNGDRVEDGRFLYAEKGPEGTIAVADSAWVVPPAGTRVLTAGFDKNLLCGLADRSGEGLGLGILLGIDFSGAPRVHLHTPVAARRIRILQLGDLYVSPDGRELTPPRRGRAARGD